LINMYRKIVWLASLAIVMVLIGMGCEKAPGNEAAPKESSSALNIIQSPEEYNWKTQGISFKYPADMFVIDLGDRLYINGDGAVLPEGYADLYYTQLDITEDATVEQVIQTYKADETILKGFAKEKIGDYTFDKIEYEDPITSEIYRHYILQIRNNVLDYRVGNNNHKGDKNLTLSSLTF
ncbi:MAG: hypothetical protein AAB906_02585, partial [Patescibacteria group bacterium]